MSHFLCRLKAEITGKRIPTMERLLTVDRRIIEYPAYRVPRMNEVDVSVKLGSKVRCLPKQNYKALNNIYLQLKDLIYGDFTKLLLELEIALLEQDLVKATEIVEKAQDMIDDPRNVQ